MAPKKEEKQLSAFELMRLKNMAANKAILNGIETTAAKIMPPSKPHVPKTSSRSSRPPRRSEPVKREPTRPTRQSARLAGIGTDSDVLTRKRAVEEENEAEKARQKRTRVSGDLSLGDIIVEGRKYESGLDGIKGLAVRGAQPGVRTFTEEDIIETTDDNLKELRTRMGKLQLYEKWAVQGTLVARI